MAADGGGGGQAMMRPYWHSVWSYYLNKIKKEIKIISIKS